MKTYHFHYWILVFAIGIIVLSALIMIYDDEPLFMSVTVFICGLALIFYGLAYIEIDDETLTVRWMPYKKLVIRKVHLKDIKAVTVLNKSRFTAFLFWLDPESASYTNWPAIGWPHAYQVGLETRNSMALVMDILQRIPGVEIDDMARSIIMQYSLRKR